MENPVVNYKKSQYLETSKGNKLSKKTMIKGYDQIQTLGKCIIQDKCILRGDLAPISAGKCCIFLENITVHPSYKRIQGQNLQKENESSHRVVIHDNVKILDDSIIPPDTIIPPNTVYGGKPAVFISQLPETTQFIHSEQCLNYYNKFIGLSD